ncbi:hypothetical protein [Streptomyces mesophilus]|uniref:hypothetical protein n=1 Tax=Streptomyces mesophilus TaxID=1775132 RepID=UPI003329FB4A
MTPAWNTFGTSGGQASGAAAKRNLMSQLRPLGQVLAVSITVMAAVSCTSGSQPDSVTKVSPKPVANLVGKKLDAAVETAISSDLAFSLRDSTDSRRNIDTTQLNRYRVCFTQHSKAIAGIDLYAVPAGEKCPETIGQRANPASVPDVVGKSATDALDSLSFLGFVRDSLTVEDIKRGELDHSRVSNLTVCAQQPKAGSEFNPDEPAGITVSETC